MKPARRSRATSRAANGPFRSFGRSRNRPRTPARTVVVQAYATAEALDAATVERVVEALDALRAREAAAEAAAEHLAVLESHPNRELREFLSGTLGLAAAG